MKKLLSIILIFVLLLSLIACGGENSKQTEKPNVSQTENTVPQTEKATETGKEFLLSGNGGNRYFGDAVTFVNDKGYDKQYWYKPLKLKVREINILDIGLNEPITIGAVSDTHLCSNPAAIDSFTGAMETAQLTDSVVVCGDIVENFRSETNANIFKKYFLEQFKDTLCVVGNHDRYSDDFNENDEYVKNIWPHDHRYYSKTVKDKVILVGVDNSYETFYPEQCEELDKEIESAREKGQIIIFVHHIPLHTMDCSSGVNKQMYDLLINNTDVVKLALAGHAHGDSKTMVGNLPVYTLEGTGHDRMNKNVLIITIK